MSQLERGVGAKGETFAVDVDLRRREVVVEFPYAMNSITFTREQALQFAQGLIDGAALLRQPGELEIVGARAPR